MSEEALYYPYTNVHCLDSLKAMILYFDKINIIDPTNNQSPEGPAADNGVYEFEKLKMIDHLEQMKLINRLSPEDLLSEYEEILTKSVIADLNDPEFLEMGKLKSYNLPIFEVNARKVPSKFKIAANGGYDLSDLWKGKLEHFFHETSIPQSLERPHGNYAFYNETVEYEEHIYRGKKYNAPSYGTIMLPFEFGESLMINHALCAASRFGFTPITDERIHHDFLMFKLGTRQNSKIVRELLENYRYIKDVKSNLTAIDIISETLPVLKGASINDVLEFRDENKDYLNRFRIEMSSLATNIEATFGIMTFIRE